jgi:hypothetical protein
MSDKLSKYDWQRRIVVKQNQNLRGTNQSSGRSSVGSRGIAKSVVAGGLTGGGIGKNAINTDQAGNIQTSTHLNLQHSVLPLVSDANIVITTFNAPNYTADIAIYGSTGSTSAVIVYRPDGSELLCHPAGSGTGWDLGHDFVSAHAVYTQVYFDVFFDGAGNGRYVANWGTAPFTAAQLATSYADNKIPFLSTTLNTNTGLTAGTSGTYQTQIFGPGGGSPGNGAGGGAAGLTSIAGETGPNITVGSSDSSVVITPTGNNIDLKTATHGTVTAVTASSPLSSSGGATPNITITSPLPVANGGTGTTTPSLVGGTNISISGSWPNQTVTDTGPSGTVTSVGLALPGEFTVSGSPVTSSGTLTGAWASQLQNQVFAAPSGSAGTPSFRLLVASDIPNLPASIITSGQLALARGGTNADLSGTGGASFVLRQSSTGAAITVSQLSFSNISGSVAAAQLPNPTATTLGGIESYAAVSNQWINAISTSGVPSSTQPAFSNISGTVAASQLPNPTASTLGGIESLAAVTSKWINTISTSGVPSATQPAFTDISGNLSSSQLPNNTLPTMQTFLTAGSGTYTTPANVKWIRVRAIGGGGGGGATGTSPGSSGTGGSTLFGTSLINANGSGGSVNENGTPGGGSTFGSAIGMAITGGAGATAPNVNGGAGGNGGDNSLGGGGQGGSGGGGPGGNGVPNTGGGGGGAGLASGPGVGGAGGAGFVDAIINSPSATYSYTVGASGAGATAGTGGQAGGNGGSGGIWVEEHYNY